MAIPPDDQRDEMKFAWSKMIGGYIDNCIRICVVVFVADLLQRLFYVSTEYFLYSRHYLLEDRLVTIVKRNYTYKKETIYLALTVVFTGLTRYAGTSNLNSLLPNSEFLIYVPLYWIFSYVQLSHSTLSYAQWVREPHGLDYGSGMASNYFHGYLKLSLPDRNDNGLQKRIQNYEDRHNVKFGLDRLIILLPDEMFIDGVIKSSLLEKAEPLETHFINRAGVRRPFKHDVYRLKKEINNTTYYFAMEGSTPMLSFFDSMHFPLSSTWQMQDMKREIWLKFSKHLRELLNTWPETRRLVDLVIYNSHKPNGEPVDVGEVLIAHALAQFEKNKLK